METISDLMDHDLTGVSPFDTVEHAIRIMQRRKRDALPVCAGKRFLGIITSQEAERWHARSPTPRSTSSRVRDAMDRSMSCCHSDETPEEACRRLGALGIGRAPVVTHDMQLQGTVSLHELAHHLAPTVKPHVCKGGGAREPPVGCLRSSSANALPFPPVSRRGQALF